MLLLLIPLQIVTSWHELFCFFETKNLAHYLLTHIFECYKWISCDTHGETCIFQITTLARNLLFWHVQINQYAKSNHFWKTLSVKCPTRIWPGYQFNSLRVKWLNDDADRPSPFRAFSFVLLSSNVCILSTFSLVATDRLLLEFLISAQACTKDILQHCFGRRFTIKC